MAQKLEENSRYLPSHSGCCSVGLSLTSTAKSRKGQSLLLGQDLVFATHKLCCFVLRVKRRAVGPRNSFAASSSLHLRSFRGSTPFIRRLSTMEPAVQAFSFFLLLHCLLILPSRRIHTESCTCCREKGWRDRDWKGRLRSQEFGGSAQAPLLLRASLCHLWWYVIFAIVLSRSFSNLPTQVSRVCMTTVLPVAP